MNDTVMNFDFFDTGMVLGSTEVAIAPLMRDWAGLFPGTPGHDGHAPAALLVAIMMRGYLTIVDRRPPGNVHAGQKLHWGAPAARDATVTVGLRCLGKERRGERPWLTFGATVEGSGGVRHLDGTLRMLWAA